jgi:hypothetical protein
MKNLRTISYLGLLAAAVLAAPAAPAAALQDPRIASSPTIQSVETGAAKARTKLKVDDGSAEQVVGLQDSSGAREFQIVVLNRFTPASNMLPFTLETIMIKFQKTCQAGDTGLRSDMTFEALVYLDPTGSGDPNNAMLVARQPFQLAPSDARFQKIDLQTPVQVTAGDVWVGYTNTESATNSTIIYHAALDTTNPRGRSWIFYNRSTSSFTGDLLSNAEVKHTIDQEGIPGNWLIRAKGRISGS